MGALVLAMNPSIDAEWRVDEVRWEEKNSIRAERRWAGGKGVNVARWLRYLQGDPRLLLPLGGATGTELARYLHAEKLKATVIPLMEPSRVNVIVTTEAGRQLRFNPAGPKLSAEEFLATVKNARELLGAASSFVISGSLPRGVGPAGYAQLIKLARRANVKSVLDCDGAALKVAVRAQPFLVKPNEHELAEWAGRPLKSEAALMGAANALSATTRGWVLVSLGRRGGLLVNVKEGFECSAHPPTIKAVNSVGAGDALVAAVTRQIDLKASPKDWLRWGIATGAVAAQCAAGELPALAVVEKLLRKVVVT
ncbi:MAG: tagatose-6-phosphate kinase [Pedosphaera sp.]|nr:tagatose-6-phosphate kinase [Pedosphaera sp.]